MTTRMPAAQRFAAALVVFAATVLAATSRPAPVAAHGDIEVGPYSINLGFINEPAYAGEPNGLDLTVMRHAPGAAATDDHADAGTSEEGAPAADVHDDAASDDHAHAEAVPAEDAQPAGPAPVEGLEETLQAEIIFGAESRILAIEPQWGQPGKYTAAILPTAAGDYTWRVFGTVDGTPVDVKLSSGPDTFGAVETKAAVSFPAAEPDVAGLRTEVDAAAKSAADAAASARTALLAGAAGVALGAFALATAALQLRSRPR